MFEALYGGRINSMKTRRLAAIGFLVEGGAVLIAMVLPVGAVTFAQEGGSAKSLAGGAYSDTQASRGERVYRGSCESCHSTDLQGSEMGPSLRGEVFLAGWEGEPLSELMLYIKSNMPEDAPGALSESDYQEVLAFLLSANGFPPGDELTPASMEKIFVEPQD